MYSEARTELASETTRRVRHVVDLAVSNETGAPGIEPGRPLTPQGAGASRPDARSMLAAFRAERIRRRLVNETEITVDEVLAGVGPRSLPRDMTARADPG